MEGDEDLLHRVVSNLVLNAVQAGGKDARVVVRTGRPGPQEVPGGAGVGPPGMRTAPANGPGVPGGPRAPPSEPSVPRRCGATGGGTALVARRPGGCPS